MLPEALADLRVDLRAGAEMLGVALPDEHGDRLLAYIGMLAKWNRVYNLTAVRMPQDMLTQHLLDSMALIGPLQRTKPKRSFQLADVGSGGGLPGVVLAVCLPEISVTCIDAVGKKASFIRQVALELGLQNLKAEHSRVEALPSAAYDVVCSRAFASLADFTKLTSHLLKRNEGIWVALKGTAPENEIQELPSGVEVFHVEPLSVPGLPAERCLVWMRPSTAPAR